MALLLLPALAASPATAAREAAPAAARLQIAAANRLDPEAIEPLLACHASDALAGAPAPLMTIDGLQRPDAARRVVLPVAAAPVGDPRP